MSKGQIVKMGPAQGYAYDNGRAMVQIACHHKKGAVNGACAGCYARLALALEAIAARPDLAGIIAQQTAHEMRNDREETP